MELLKNKEIRIFLIITALVGGAASLAMLFYDRRAAAACGGLTVGFMALYLADSALRFRRMRRLSDSIDRLLAGAEAVELSRYNEGELSILENELTKLTLRLREQTSELKKDKQMLADSIADISHQIRTPLTTLNLIASALNKPGTDEAARTELMIELRQQLARIDWLVSALLMLARLDADAVHMAPAEVTLRELIERALDPLLIPMELKEQTCEKQISGSVTCDLSWTAEALTNIMKNCSEHMQAGTLYITARENPLYSEIVIRDTGTGIAKEDLPHLFERFYKGRNSGKASVGIGLALCRMIIAKQNGTVKAENAKEGGALFTVRLYKGTV